MTIVHNVIGEISKQVEDDKSNVRRPTVFESASNVNEELFIHQEASILASHKNIEPATVLKLATSRVADVQQSGQLVPFSDPNLFAKLFPHLFPYGEGHPGKNRKVSVSVQECVKHYLRLSSRRFPQDETFPLTAFDIISRKKSNG